MSFLSPLKKFFGAEDSIKAPDDIKLGGGKYEKYLIAIDFDGTLAMLKNDPSREKQKASDYAEQLSKEELTNEQIVQVFGDQQDRYSKPGKSGASEEKI